jgi:SAM-dependent methyltransferase
MNEDFSQTRLDIDVDFYRSLHPDLHVLTDSQLAEHYHRCGEHEGRPASPLSFVNILLDSIRSSEDALEVGPNCSPKLRGERVRYFDVLDSAGLAARAASAGAPGQIAPHIDYVSPLGDLSIVETAAFDAIFSSHCIEHVPDLIRHLNQAARILRPGGRYLLMIPDKRYCHDHYIAASTVAEVIQVYHEQRVTHGIANYVQNFALTTHNDSKRHWAGDHGVQKIVEDPGAFARAMQIYQDASGGYTDLHAWRFTPRGFRDLLNQIAVNGLIGLWPSRVVGTLRNINSFMAILTHAP